MTISPPSTPPVVARAVDQLLTDGRTLPPEFYTSNDFYAHEREIIFKHDWLFACTEYDLVDPGDYVTVNVAEVPVVVLRDKAGDLKAFVNVCRHRANVIMKGSGNCQRMQCGYHAWTYGLDGALIGAPKFREGKLPPFESLGLEEVSVDTYGGFVFVALEPRHTLMEQLGDVPEILAAFDYDFPLADPDGSLRRMPQYDGADTVECNWKVFLENGQECYHCPHMHPDSFGALCDFDLDYRISTSGRFNTLLFADMLDEVKEKYADRLPADGRRPGLLTVTLWPNVQVISGSFGVHVLRFEPVGASKMRYQTRSYAPSNMSDDLFDELYGLVMAQTGLEDIEAVEGVQRGLASGRYRSGPLMANLEEMIQAFQRQVWDLMRPAYAADDHDGFEKEVV
jgi:phenylpropionate dioxygenase-like ring-hydroxylating dioxygenase large terminal subunit